MNILRALDDPAVFGSQFRDPATWAAWRVFLSALFGLPIAHGPMETYKLCTGRQAPSPGGHREAWLCCGRRSGKSRVLATVAVFLACFRDWRPYLGPGERGTIMIIAADRKQARAIMNFVRGLLEVPMLARTVEMQGQEAIHLANRVSIEVHTASFRSTRGYTIVAALCDEISVWPTDDSADPDFEVLAALRPGMLTIPGSMLLCASSPYARRGALFDAHRKHYGKDGGEVLVWQASTRMMNPTVSQSTIDAEIAKDPARATAEYGATFRTDFEAFITREAVEACVSLGVLERPPIVGEKYFGFIDPSGGSGDSFTMAIAHRDGELAVLDLVREAKPPFSPESIVAEYAADLKRYRIGQVTSDRYAAEWPREQFRKRGIEVKPTDRSKSELYLDLLPVLNSRRCDLLDHGAILGQLVSLERRTARAGRDTIDHAQHAHDDVANAVAGVIHLALQRDRDVLQMQPIASQPAKIFDLNTGVHLNRPREPLLRPTGSNAEIQVASLRQQHEEMRRFVEPNRPPVDWDALAAARKEREESQPARVLFYGKLLGGGR
jgi:Terminase large subunit, T4likevirus-type, N-terminal